MAREIVFTDDLSGEHGAEPVRIGWNDTWFEVDLAEANRKKLTDFIETYINAGRPAGRETPPARQRAARGSGGGGSKREITEEEYGLPRRGRASAEEANYVKTHLDEVNKRRVEAGYPPIDPSDEKMKARFGL